VEAGCSWVMSIRSGFKRFVRWLLLPAIIASVLVQAAPAALADDVQKELQRAQQQLDLLQRQKQQTKNLLADAYWLTEQARIQLQTTETELAMANSQLAVRSNQLTVAEQELERVEVDLELATEIAHQQKELLAKRIRGISEAGRVNYLAVLFGANSFGDFLSRYDMLKVVVSRDAQLFEVVKRERQALEARQAEAVNRRTRLAELRLEAELNRNAITSIREERQVATRSLESNRQRLESQYADFDRQEEAMRENVAEIQRRLARIAGRFTPQFPVSPVRITDQFGGRMHPILGSWRQHNGTDFAANTGQAVWAIEDGLVIVSGWNDAFGELIVIDHGGNVSSWYGHSSKRLVRVGDTVRRGQRIADAGSTGWSTGPHVHLEIHVNGKPVNPMEYLK